MPGRIKNTRQLSGCFSAETGNRTQDTTIFSRVLYQLSYLGELVYSTRGMGVCQEDDGGLSGLFPYPF